MESLKLLDILEMIKGQENLNLRLEYGCFYF